MPITTHPSPQLVGFNRDRTVASAEELLKKVSTAWAPIHATTKMEPETRSILQSTFQGLNSNSNLIPYGNGFVNGVLRAFQQDLHLVLRPDDIWLAILTQFSMFVNANSKRLREHFVAHEGKKDLRIDMRPDPISSIDMGKFAQQMTLLIEEEVLDPELHDWIMPDFTTTTNNDKSVAAIVMMGTLQEYFSYGMKIGCGFPSVTLLGEKSDWEEINSRIQKLPEYGEEPAEWCPLLTTVLANMIATFEQPNSEQVKDFWMKIGQSAGANGSENIETISGWITAFCFWSAKGRRIKGYSDKELEKLEKRYSGERQRLVLDGTSFTVIGRADIPKGVVSVPVTVEDYASGLKYETTLVAGSMGMTATTSQGAENMSTVQPRSGWIMLEDSVKPIEGFKDCPLPSIYLAGQTAEHESYCLLA